MAHRKSIPFIMLMAFIAGCNTPGTGVWGGETTRLAVGAHKFKIIHTAIQAEAYRVNPVARPKTEEVVPAALEAIAMATGCRIDLSSVEADVALIKADLIC